MRVHVAHLLAVAVIVSAQPVGVRAAEGDDPEGPLNERAVVAQGAADDGATDGATDGAAVATQLDGAPAPVRTHFNPSSGARGTMGVHRVEAGHRLPPGELVLTLSGSYFQATGLLCADPPEPGSGCLTGSDNHTRQRQVLSLVWAVPWVHGLELFLNQTSTTNTNDAFAQPATQILGDPELAVKYTYELNEWIGAGAVASVMFPTSVRGSGLKPQALRFTFLGASSFAFTEWLQLSANVGLTFDNTGQLFCGPQGNCRDIDRSQQFAAQVSQAQWMVPVGVGLGTHFALFDLVGLGPFAELTMAIVPDAPAFEESPMLASAGLKVYPAHRGLLELAVGADVRLLGAPRSGVLPGVPPWEVFGRVSAHLFAVEKAPPAGAVAATNVCAVESDCGAGFTCVEGACVVVREVVRTEEVVKETPTWRIEGKVIDKDSKAPVPNAVVSISGTPYSDLAAHPETGEFKSFPLEVGEGIVKVQARASGFLPGEYTMPRGAADEVKPLVVALQKITGAMTGELKGSLKDARTGKVLAGQVFIPKLGKRIAVDQAGQFLDTLKAGRYQVLVSSRGYITQKKEIEIRPGDVVILNIDLAPRRR